MNQKANIIEVFSSIQGEGLYIGHRQVFVRFANCNLNCAYCDTPFSESEFARIENKSGNFELTENPITSQKLASIIKKTYVKNTHSVSFTGGEPLLHQEFLQELIPQIKPATIFLETNGTLPDELEKIVDLTDIIAMDIKLESSTHSPLQKKQQRKFIEISKKANKEVFIKAVICSQITTGEMNYLADIAEEFNLPLVLQPMTTTDKNLILSAQKLNEIHSKILHKVKNCIVIPQSHILLGVN